MVWQGMLSSLQVAQCVRNARQGRRQHHTQVHRRRPMEGLAEPSGHQLGNKPLCNSILKEHQMLPCCRTCRSIVCL